MSKDKSYTTATIKFYPNKHIEVELDDLRNVQPRAISIANNLLTRKYLEMRSQFNAAEHKERREAAAKAAKEAEKNSAKFHANRDEELAKASDEKEIERRRKLFEKDRANAKEQEMAAERARIQEREKKESDAEKAEAAVGSPAETHAKRSTNVNSDA